MSSPDAEPRAREDAPEATPVSRNVQRTSSASSRTAPSPTRFRESARRAGSVRRREVEELRHTEVELDEERARTLLQAERAEVERLLYDTRAAQQLDQTVERETGDSADAAQALTDEEFDDAFATDLRERLAALDRAEARLSDGTFGRSIRSGLPIPDERLEADPAAELTVEEAEAEQ